MTVAMSSNDTPNAVLHTHWHWNFAVRLTLEMHHVKCLQAIAEVERRSKNVMLLDPEKDMRIDSSSFRKMQR